MTVIHDIFLKGMKMKKIMDTRKTNKQKPQSSTDMYKHLQCFATFLDLHMLPSLKHRNSFQDERKCNDAIQSSQNLIMHLY